MRLTADELAMVGVEIVKIRNITLSCMVCGEVWSPAVLASGCLPNGYWKCPNGCNESVMEKTYRAVFEE